MRQLQASCLAAALIFSACASTPPPAPTPEPEPVDPVQARIAQTVLDAMDANTAPCEDFYQYACGGWEASTAIPDDQSRWTRSFNVIAEQNREVLRALLAAPIQAPDAPGARAQTLYQACMDLPTVEARGLEPLQPWLTRIDNLKRSDQLMATLGALHRESVGGLFAFYVSPDAKAPERNIAILSQGGLGLPDRDYYLEDQHAEIRAAYEAHIATMFSLAGVKEADAARQAKAILALETALATPMRPRAKMRDPEETYNKRTRAQLTKMTGKLNLDAYLKALGAPAFDEAVVRTPETFEALPALIKKTPIDALRAYLRWNLLRANADILPERFSQASFAFYGQRLNGQKQQQERWKRCVNLSDGLLGEDVGKLYVDSRFAGDSKTIALELVRVIEEAFHDNLKQVSWMDEVTRASANNKVDSLYNKIGYPDQWRDYSALTIPSGDLFGGVVAARAFDTERSLNDIGQPVDLKRWYMSPPTVNAYYTPFGNQIVFPAGILQAPFFDRDFPMAMNFGGIGMVIGHEITHGFDDKGRKFDPRGQLTPWWQPDAIARFEERAQCIDQHYSAIEVQPGQRINGQLTMGENIADLGGLKVAHLGYQRWLQENPETPKIGDLTGDQLFFVAFAQSWCALTTPENERMRLVRDSHSPPRYRVNATLQNMPAFHDAFQCAPQTPMRKDPVCEIW